MNATRVNLIPHGRRDQQDARRRRRAWGRFMRVYGFLCLAACGLAFLPARAAPASLDSSIERLDKRIEASTKSLDDMKRQIDKLARQVDAARAVGDHPDWSALLGALARIRVDENGGVMLEGFDLSIVKPEKSKDAPAAGTAAKTPKPHDYVLVKLSGVANSTPAAFQFAGRIEKLNLFDKVEVKNTRAQLLGQMAATHFDLEMTVPMAAPASPGTPSSGASK